MRERSREGPSAKFSYHYMERMTNHLSHGFVPESINRIPGEFASFPHPATNETAGKETTDLKNKLESIKGDTRNAEFDQETTKENALIERLSSSLDNSPLETYIGIQAEPFNAKEG